MITETRKQNWSHTPNQLTKMREREIMVVPSVYHVGNFIMQTHAQPP